MHCFRFWQVFDRFFCKFFCKFFGGFFGRSSGSSFSLPFFFPHTEKPILFSATLFFARNKLRDRACGKNAF